MGTGDTSIKGGDRSRMRHLGLQAIYLIYDILVVNLSYYLALIIRFWVGFEFYDKGLPYIPRFGRFAPIYTVACIACFLAFRLYSTVWRYVGINDIKRILAANVCTCVLQVAGSLALVGRMPISYYCIGACLQFMFMSVSRFLPRYVMNEFYREVSGTGRQIAPVMIVGVGRDARLAQSEIDLGGNLLAMPVCAWDYRGEAGGRILNGMPVVTDLRKGVQRYRVQYIVIAESIPREVRDEIGAVCAETGAETVEFRVRFEKGFAKVDFYHLMNTIRGEVRILREDGSERRYPDGPAAIRGEGGFWNVREVGVAQGIIRVTIEKTKASMSTDWIEEYEARTGEKASFF